ncbi:MAG: hypothetical protein SFX73_12325 [Kofleriaceae bacterium]|nr:hypothetical protein [Kofleriaceae bacterium]
MLAGPGLSKQNALDRLTTQTCMGCHDHSSDKDLGNEVLGFVHVDEDGAISQALTDVFMPGRAAIMTQIVEADCEGASAPLPFKLEGAVN